MGNFVSACPKCSEEFEASDGHIGRAHSCSSCGQECIIPSQRIDPGITFGDFTILYPLGIGASGEVHLGKKSDGTKAALKILFMDDIAPEEMDVKRFFREARFINDLEHPGIIKIFDSGLEHNFNYIAMEYVRGETIDEHLDKFGAIDIPEAVKIARDVASVLCYVWNENRLVHRDIKPSNIMVGYDGVTKVMDLGIAKSFLLDLTQLTDPETIIGSPPYMSPEQCSPAKPLDFRADVYSLGCTLYQMLTNEYAFFGDTPMKTVKMQIFEKPTDPREYNSDIPEELVTLMTTKMMAKSVTKRPDSWESLISDLDKIIARY
jgi:serine/threonine protein kinase